MARGLKAKREEAPALNPANLLTMLRIVLVPVFAGLMLLPPARLGHWPVYRPGGPDGSGLDGWLARRFGWVTAMGIFIDPMADKLLQADWPSPCWRPRATLPGLGGGPALGARGGGGPAVSACWPCCGSARKCIPAAGARAAPWRRCWRWRPAWGSPSWACPRLGRPGRCWRSFSGALAAPSWPISSRGMEYAWHGFHGLRIATPKGARPHAGTDSGVGRLRCNPPRD